MAWLIRVEEDCEVQRAVERALRGTGEDAVLLVLLEVSQGRRTRAMVDCVTRVYRAVATASPRRDVRVVTSRPPGAQEFNWRALAATEEESVTAGQDELAQNTAESCEEVPQFDTVCVGGTFDRLHAGHRLLLTTSAFHTRKQLIVGLTTNALLVNKSLAELIEPFSEREMHVRQLLDTSAPGLEVIISPLDDPSGPAVTRRNLDAIVVTPETIAGAHKINEQRKLRDDFPQLVIIQSDLLFPCGVNDKLSSTNFRVQDAATSCADVPAVHSR